MEHFESGKDTPLNENHCPQELLGTLKAIEDNRAMSRRNKEAALVEILAHVAKQDTSEKMQGVLAVAMPMFDNTMLALWRRLAAHGMAWARFLKIRKAAVPLIVGASGMAIVAAASGDFASCGASIRRLRQSSHLGAALFCSAATLCAGKALEEATMCTMFRNQSFDLHS